MPNMFSVKIPAASSLVVFWDPALPINSEKVLEMDVSNSIFRSSFLWFGNGNRSLFYVDTNFPEDI